MKNIVSMALSAVLLLLSASPVVMATKAFVGYAVVRSSTAHGNDDAGSGDAVVSETSSRRLSSCYYLTYSTSYAVGYYNYQYSYQYSYQVRANGGNIFVVPDDDEK